MVDGMNIEASHKLLGDLIDAIGQQTAECGFQETMAALNDALVLVVAQGSKKGAELPVLLLNQGYQSKALGRAIESMKEARDAGGA